MLDDNDIKYEIVPTLVRGLDYYSHTVFEFQNTFLGAQDSFGGGGRYNKLFSELGGNNVPAVGFAMGMERLLLILEQINFAFDTRKIDITIIPTNEKYIKLSTNISQLIKNNFTDISCIMDVSRRSMKAQLREANKLSSRLVIIIGDTEFETNSVTIKFMQEQKEQTQIKITELVEFIRNYFK
jgi:histidyl-tRNA synthetase